MSAVSPRAPTLLRVFAVAGVRVAIVGTVMIWVFLGDQNEPMYPVGK